jgi:tRNA A-37 threonylcarbamoyl transferase component Bud32
MLPADHDSFPRRLGPYAIVHLLGQGGMGSVYLALMGSKRAAKPCVIKQMGSAWLNRAACPVKDMERRFHREAEISLALSHPAIAKAYAYHKEPGPPYLVQEFIDGLNLRDLVWQAFSTAETIDLPLAAYMVMEVAGALAYLHAFESRELVHRDVTPDNVMVSRAGEVKLIDFGVAKSTAPEGNTSQRSMAGKLDWMAPELFRGANPDARVDTYDLGMLAWHILARRDPATTLSYRDSPTSWLPPPSAFNPDVPLALDRLVEKAIDPDPDLRFQTAREFREAFARYLPTGYPARAETAALVERRAGPLINSLHAKLLAQGQSLLDDGPVAATKVPAAPGRRRRTLPLSLGAMALSIVVALLAFGSRPPVDASLVQTRQPSPAAMEPSALIPNSPTVTPKPGRKDVENRPARAGAPPVPIADPDIALPRHGDESRPSPLRKIRAEHRESRPSPNALLASAMDSFDRAELPEALGEATRAAEHGAGAAAFVLIGRIRALQQDFGGAQAAYHEALRFAPDNAEAKRRLDRLRQAPPEAPP